MDYLAIWIGSLSHCPDAEEMLRHPEGYSDPRADPLFERFQEMVVSKGHHITIGYLPLDYVNGIPYFFVFFIIVKIF